MHYGHPNGRFSMTRQFRLTAALSAAFVYAVIPQATAQQPGVPVAHNVSESGPEMSSNDAGLQARWTYQGRTFALFTTGPVDLRAAASGRVSGSGHLVLIEERDALRVFEWHGGMPQDLPADVRESIEIGAGQVARLTGQSPGRLPGSTLKGLPARSEDPSARVIQAGWLDGGVRVGLALRGRWTTTTRGLESRDSNAWFVVFAYDEQTRRSQRVQIVQDATGRLAATSFVNGAQATTDDATMAWAVASFGTLQRMMN
jgi:hypothetical protein